MSEENWKLERDLCRCCLSEGSFKNLAEPCLYEGQEEIYSEMLLEHLSVNLTPVSGPLCTSTYTICEECILRLRDACGFKRQVLLSEKRFRDLYARDVIQMQTSSIGVKKEVPDSDHEANEDDVKVEYRLDDDDDFRLDYDDDDNKSDLELDLQSAKKAKTKKPKAKDKPKPKKRAGRPRKKEAETAAGEAEPPKEKKGSKAGKFRLAEADYSRDGDAYRCCRCEKTYDKMFSLRSHVKTKHYKIPRYPCPHCEEVFMTPAPLTVHKLNAHHIDDRFKCNACKGTFNTKVQLRKHINNFHMMGERYKCDLCEYESFSFEGMYKHKFKHKTVKDFHCRFCRKAFLRKTTLDLHERIHTGDRRKVCAVCGKAFVQKASLNYHMAKYHPEVNF